ncbi:MAG: GUN4 domain-containing protein [Cyanobacteria bacterium P01_H01_bin.105]
MAPKLAFASLWALPTSIAISKEQYLLIHHKKMTTRRPGKYPVRQIVHSDHENALAKMIMKKPWLILTLSIFSIGSLALISIQTFNVNFNFGGSVPDAPAQADTLQPAPASAIPADIEEMISALEKALKAQDWDTGNSLTYDIFAVSAGLEKGSYLKTADINNISCATFNKVDQLWKRNSQGKFGFSVQNQVATRENLMSDWLGMGKAFGWVHMTEYTGSAATLEEFPEGAYPGWAGLKAVSDTNFHIFPKVNACLGR